MFKRILKWFRKPVQVVIVIPRYRREPVPVFVNVYDAQRERDMLWR